MARKIMEDIGGAVELASSPGKGTSVTLLLPPVLAVAQSAPTA
jgi:chemotaxis protein histidine kinase CheA